MDPNDVVKETPFEKLGETETTPPPSQVQVVAPLDLPEGSTFVASVGEDGRTFTAVVPAGGVKEGQTFMTTLPEDFNEERINAPRGYWKDGLFDCFSLGILHSSVICAFCCTQIAMGQVMQRARLDWLGFHSTKEIAMGTFRIVLVLSISSIIFSNAMDLYEDNFWNNGQEPPAFVLTLKYCGEFLFALWAIFALYKTRRSIRQRYDIPEERCHGCEDLACSILCSCCTIAQLARHTGEYETYQGKFCSETGLPPEAPMAV